MAHEVSVNLHTKLVQSKDVVIEVKTSDGRLGKLLISKGNVEWLPSGNSVNKYRMSWSKFAKFMEENGKNIRVEK